MNFDRDIGYDGEGGGRDSEDSLYLILNSLSCSDY